MTGGGPRTSKAAWNRRLVHRPATSLVARIVILSPITRSGRRVRENFLYSVKGAGEPAPRLSPPRPYLRAALARRPRPGHSREEPTLDSAKPPSRKFTPSPRAPSVAASSSVLPRPAQAPALPPDHLCSHRCSQDARPGRAIAHVGRRLTCTTTPDGTGRDGVPGLCKAGVRGSSPLVSTTRDLHLCRGRAVR